jgi:hypothetical protein
MRRSRTSSLVLTVPFILAAAACSSTEPGTPQDFTGSYTLVSFSTGTAAALFLVPGTTGSGTLTATGYTISITFPAGTLASNDSTIVDHGTYTATGTATSGTWTQQSTDDLTLQYSGTYEFNGTTGDLTLDTTAQGVRTVVVLRKT